MENGSKHQEHNNLYIEVAKECSQYHESLKKDEEFSVLKKHRDKIKFLKKQLSKNNQKETDFPGDDTN